MKIEPMFKTNAREKIIEHVYKASYQLIYADYKRLIKEWLKLEGKEPEDMAIYHVELDNDLYWVGGKFRKENVYGLENIRMKQPNMRKKLKDLNQQKREMNAEKEIIRNYVAKVLTESKNLAEIHKFLPAATHGLMAFNHFYDVNEKTLNPGLMDLADKYLEIMNSRVLINLITKE